MLEKKIFFNFLGANFVAPKNLTDVKKQPVLGRGWNTTTKNFISCCFILAFTSVDIIFHKFLKLHSALSVKIILQRIHSTHPFNGQNPLSIMKVFCCSSLIFFGD